MKPLLSLLHMEAGSLKKQSILCPGQGSVDAGAEDAEAKKAGALQPIDSDCQDWKTSTSHVIVQGAVSSLTNRKKVGLSGLLQALIKIPCLTQV